MKITVEVDVPEGDFCEDRKISFNCSLLKPIIGKCTFFDQQAIYTNDGPDGTNGFIKCPACLAACEKAKKDHP